MDPWHSGLDVLRTSLPSPIEQSRQCVVAQGLAVAVRRGRLPSAGESGWGAHSVWGFTAPTAEHSTALLANRRLLAFSGSACLHGVV